MNRVLLDSDWETGFCRVAESHSRVKVYVKNHNLGLEVPYRYGSEMRVDDGCGDEDVLHLVVETKGYRRKDAKEKKEKKATTETYGVLTVDTLGTLGRWAFRLRDEGGARAEREWRDLPR